MATKGYHADSFGEPAERHVIKQVNTVKSEHRVQRYHNMSRPTKTIGNARAAGQTRFTVHCGRIECGHRAQMAFDELKLPVFPGCSISFARIAAVGA